MLVNVLLFVLAAWPAPHPIPLLACALLWARFVSALTPTSSRMGLVRNALWPSARRLIHAADARGWTRLADVVESLAERLAHRLLGCGCAPAIGADGPCRELAGPGEAVCLCPGHGLSLRQVQAENDELAVRDVLLKTGACVLGPDALEVIVQRTALTPERATAALRALDADGYLEVGAQDPTKPRPTPWQAPPAEPAPSEAPRLLMQAMASAAAKGRASGEGGDHGKSSEADRGAVAGAVGAARLRPQADAPGREASVPAPLPSVPGAGAREAAVTVDERRRAIGWTGAAWKPPVGVPGASPSLNLELRPADSPGELEEDDDEVQRKTTVAPPAAEPEGPRETPVPTGDEDDQAVTRPMAKADLERAAAMLVAADVRPEQSGVRIVSRSATVLARRAS
jgi:hypothetical protein